MRAVDVRVGSDVGGAEAGIDGDLADDFESGRKRCDPGTGDEQQTTRGGAEDADELAGDGNVAVGDEALLIDIKERNGEQVTIRNLASIAHQEIIFRSVEDVLGDGAGGEEKDA